jgi:putative heme-binding domain-containing protein
VTVGPPLDGAGRDIEYLLVNILDPNRVVGQPYFVRRVLLKRGTVEEGLLHEEDAQRIALKGENEAVRVIAKSDIETIDVIERSMMPEGLGYAMTTQDFRDLVRYVMANPPINDWQIAGPFAETLKDVPNLDGVKWERRQLGASGRLTLPKAEKPTIVYLAASIDAANEFRTPLQIEGGGTVRAWFNGREAPTGAAVEVKRGANQILVEIRYAGEKSMFAARLLDPERKLSMR